MGTTTMLALYRDEDGLCRRVKLTPLEVGELRDTGETAKVYGWGSLSGTCRVFRGAAVGEYLVPATE